jgi:hypothetical protein
MEACLKLREGNKSTKSPDLKLLMTFSGIGRLKIVQKTFFKLCILLAYDTEMFQELFLSKKGWMSSILLLIYLPLKNNYLVI